jgi:hypothetical protein
LQSTLSEEELEARIAKAFKQAREVRSEMDLLIRNKPKTFANKAGTDKYQSTRMTALSEMDKAVTDYEMAIAQLKGIVCSQLVGDEAPLRK